MTGGVAAAAASADDPVFAAIERHRQAFEARPENADEAGKLALEEGDAFLAWQKTQPTTMAGVIATLDHSSSLAPFICCGMTMSFPR
jgi:hypothetical protein